MVRTVVMHGLGGVPKWPTGADCKSAGLRLRRFESFPHHGGCDGRCSEVRSGVRVAGVAQLVERKPSKLDVAGSSPVSRLRLGVGFGWEGEKDGIWLD
jgi:hypothetical protein